MRSVPTVALVLALNSCLDLSAPPTVVVEPASISMTIGETEQLNATIVSESGDTITGLHINFTSADLTVATVSRTGLVTAVSGGETDIELRAGGIEGQVLVTVIPVTAGLWIGSIRESAAEFRLTLSESPTGAISGTATIGNSPELNVAGTHNHPNVAMTWTREGFQDTHFVGEFTDDDTIVGGLIASGFSGEVLTLERAVRRYNDGND